MREPIVIRLTVERMRQEILMALSTEEIAAEMRAAVDRAISEFDFEREVALAVPAALRSLLDEALKRAVNEVMWEPETKQALMSAVREAIKPDTPGKGGQ